MDDLDWKRSALYTSVERSSAGTRRPRYIEAGSLPCLAGACPFDALPRPHITSSSSDTSPSRLASMGKESGEAVRLRTRRITTDDEDRRQGEVVGTDCSVASLGARRNVDQPSREAKGTSSRSGEPRSSRQGRPAAAAATRRQSARLLNAAQPAHRLLSTSAGRSPALGPAASRLGVRSSRRRGFLPRALPRAPHCSRPPFRPLDRAPTPRVRAARRRRRDDGVLTACRVLLTDK